MIELTSTQVFASVFCPLSCETQNRLQVDEERFVVLVHFSCTFRAVLVQFLGAKTDYTRDKIVRLLTDEVYAQVPGCQMTQYSVHPLHKAKHDTVGALATTTMAAGPVEQAGMCAGPAAGASLVAPPYGRYGALRSVLRAPAPRGRVVAEFGAGGGVGGGRGGMVGVWGVFTGVGGGSCKRGEGKGALLVNDSLASPIARPVSPYRSDLVASTAWSFPHSKV